MVTRGAIYIYAETIITLISGYAFWLIMSKIATPGMIGASSTVVSLSTISASVAAIGIPIGIQRFLGKSFSEQKLGDIKVFVKTSLFLVSVGICICSIMIFAVYNWVSTTFRIDFSLIVVTIILQGSTVIMTLLRSIVIASLRVKVLPIMMISSTIARIILGAILVLFGTGALGISVSFTFQPVMASIFLAITIMMIFKSIPNDKKEVTFRKSLRNVLVASGANWIPVVIHTMGYSLGPLLVFGTIGASQAGLYFIAYSIFAALSAIMAVLYNISYPVLSAMQDGRKRFAWRAMKMSLIVSVPLSSSLIFYSKQIMHLFGQEYVAASSSLEILLLSMLPVAFMTGVNTLAYAYGNYRQVLIIGIASNIPSALFYFILVPFYNSITGAAISFTTGSIIGLIVSIVIAKKIEMHIFWKDLAFIFTFPTVIAFFISRLQINYLIGIVSTLAITYLLLLRLHIINRDDIHDSFAIIPYNIANPLLKVWNTFCKKN